MKLFNLFIHAFVKNQSNDKPDVTEVPEFQKNNIRINIKSITN